MSLKPWAETAKSLVNLKEKTFPVLVTGGGAWKPVNLWKQEKNKCMNKIMTLSMDIHLFKQSASSALLTLRFSTKPAMEHGDFFFLLRCHKMILCYIAILFVFPRKSCLSLLCLLVINNFTCMLTIIWALLYFSFRMNVSHSPTRWYVIYWYFNTVQPRNINVIFPNLWQTHPFWAMGYFKTKVWFSSYKTNSVEMQNNQSRTKRNGCCSFVRFIINGMNN